MKAHRLKRPELPALLSYSDKVYRPAGYRPPDPGEQYVARDGHIKTCTYIGQIRGECLIVREYQPEDFGGAAAPQATPKIGPKVPNWYKCSECGAHGVRLWRDYGISLQHDMLWCAACAEVEAAGQPAGRKSLVKSGQGDSTGWMVPCVPDKHGSVQRYTSVDNENENEGVDWWNALPISR